jgi:hypothetical protein
LAGFGVRVVIVGRSLERADLLETAVADLSSVAQVARLGDEPAAGFPGSTSSSTTPGVTRPGA